MAPIFASPDIAALVAAFPAPIPTRNQPSLVRSLSGSSLLNSEKVLARFRVLLETSPNRIKRSDLPSRLGIERAEWLPECYNDSIYYGKDGQTIIPLPELSKMSISLRHGSRETLVELSSFASKADLALESLRDLVKAETDLQTVSIDGTDYATTADLMQRTKDALKLALLGEDAEEIDLTGAFSTVPRPVLVSFATDLANQGSSLTGTIAETDQAVVFRPAEFARAQEQKRLAAREAEMVAAVRRLELDGFYPVGKEQDVPEIKSRCQIRDQSDIMIIRQDNETPIALVQRPILEEALTQLRKEVTTLAPTLRHNDGKLDAAAEADLIKSSAHQELSKLLLHSEYLKELESALNAAVVELDSAERLHFGELFQTLVMAPLHLYDNNEVADPTLKQHFDEYLVEHFRREIIPGFVSKAQEHDLLSHDKTRTRETDNLTQSCDQAKSFAEIQSPVSKFARKQKIDQPSDDSIKQVKQQTLQKKVKAMRKMSRGSDLLQNLLWILLASKTEGLWISSGKDTSRMIKQYQLVGDEETSAKLSKWRDLLKTGQEDKEALEKMRQMAMRVVAELYGMVENGDA